MTKEEMINMLSPIPDSAEVSAQFSFAGTYSAKFDSTLEGVELIINKNGLSSVVLLIKEKAKESEADISHTEEQQAVSANKEAEEAAA